ncbi:hypothetical protein M5D96_013514, partial [Drosophila gunungcola]
MALLPLRNQNNRLPFCQSTGYNRQFNLIPFDCFS